MVCYNSNKIGICVKEIFDRFLEESFDNDFKKIKTHYPMNILKIEENGSVMGYALEYALAGFSKEDIEVKVCGDVLTLTVEKKEEEEKSESNIVESYIRLGISKSAFEYSYQLTEDIDKNNIKVSYKDGILRIDLPFDKEICDVRKIKID